VTVGTAAPTEPTTGTTRRRLVVPGALVVVGVFVVVRVGYWATGGGFTTAALRTSWQLLDLRRLTADPFGSVALLHIQPPAFNLFVGVVERWSPLSAGFTYQVLYLACGLVLLLTLRALLVELGCSELAATVGTVVVALDPVLLSYENTATYELPVATLLVVSGWCCARYARTRSTGHLVAFVAAITAAALTRALLHPAWLVAAVVLVVVAVRPRTGWRAIGAAVAIPLVLIGGWMLKNQVLFDEPSMSTILGGNLARGVIAPMPRAAVDALVRDGSITPAARVRAFSAYSAYQPAIGPCRTHWTPTVVRALVKEDGISNFNSVCFLRVYHQEQHNALVLLREHPADYLGTRYAPLSIHFFHDLAPDRYHDNATLRVLTDVWNPVLARLGVTVHDAGWTNNLIPGAPPPTIPVSLTLLAATLFVLGLGTSAFARVVRRRARPGDLARAYLAGTVAFVALVSIATEYGENGRFRFLVDPIVIGLAVAQVVTWIGAWRSQHADTRAGAPNLA
jgi:hypothetical protein